MVDERLLEIREYHGDGYKPLIDFGAWRVALLRYLDDIQPDRIDSMERHIETDEVFVLLAGNGILILGGNDTYAGELTPHVMQPEKIYNVKRCVWHTILLSRDANVLLVENRNTDEQNSEYSSLSGEQRSRIMEIANHEMPGTL